jgi:hypothetical protein
MSTKGKTLAALFWVAVVLTVGLVPHKTIHGWNFEGMQRACAIETQPVHCLNDVEELEYTTQRLARAYDLKIQHQVTRYRVEQADRMTRIAKDHPKAWEVRHLVR